MVDYGQHLDAIFQALADPTRRSMLHAMRDGEQTVGQLAAPFDMSLAGASKHVQVLEKANLITRRKVGRTSFCAINEAAFIAAQDWFGTYSKLWNARLDNLETLLDQEKREANDD